MTHWLVQVPFLLLLFILPFPGTVALRLLCLSIAFVIAAAFWRRMNPPPFPGKAVFAFWIAIALLSLVYAVDAAYSLGEIKNELGYTMMALFAFYVFSGSERAVRWGAWAVVLALAVISIWSLWLRWGTGYWHEDAGHGGSGTFAGLVLMAAPALFLIWIWQPRARWLVTLIALAAGLAGAYSRQRVLWPVLGIELGGLLILLRCSSVVAISGRRAAAFLVVIVALVSILLMATQNIRITAHGGLVEMDNDVRLRYWPGVVARIADQPMIGAGFGRNAMKLAHPDLLPPDLRDFWHAHNVFLNYGLALGVPGMIALAMLFASLALTYWRMYRSPDRSLAVLGIAGIMLLTGVILRNLSNDFFLRDAALLFWSMNGLLLGYGLRLQRQSGRASQ